MTDRDARTQRALQAACVGTWCLDLASRHMECSRECSRLLLIPEPPREAAQFLSAIHEDDRSQVQAAWEAGARLQEPFSLDVRTAADANHWITIKGCAYRDSSYHPIRLEGAILDVSERKRVELALQESERKFAMLLDNLPGVVYRCRNDPQWTADFVSESVKELTGYEAAQFTEQELAFGDLIHREDRPALWQTIQYALDQRQHYHVTYRIVTRAGGLKWVAEQGRGIYSEGGELLFLEGFVTDITEHKRAEERRQQLEAQLAQAQKMEALGTLAGGIAHDFNNILAAIRGNASLAMAELSAGSSALLSVQEIDRAARRAADLVRQILAFSRPTDSERRPLALQEIVLQAVDLLRAALPALVDIRCEIASGLPNVLANETQIHQLVLNLGTNAAQAIGHGPGRIDIRLDCAVVADTQTVDVPPGRYVRLCMIDNGCGMDAATLRRIFDPFFTTKRAGQGTGLGLSVVHAIVRNHDGAISVNSTPNVGTTFEVYFPATTAPVLNQSIIDGASMGRGEHVLYVDDEEALVSVHERALQGAGYRVTGRSHPLLALEAFRSSPADFDVIVTDLSMPSMTGIQLAREVLSIRSDIPVLLTSGMLTQENARAAKKAGIKEVLPKPCMIEDLCAALARVLQR